MEVNQANHPSSITFSSLFIYPKRSLQEASANMANSSAVIDQPIHARSISIPSKPHPLGLLIQEEMQNLRTLVASATSSIPQTMSNGLQAVGDLYNSIGELLHLPRNQQTLFHSHQKKLMEAELEASCTLLDLCDVLRDSLNSAKEHAQDLQSLLRRKGTSIESKMHAYIRLRKNTEKAIKRSFRSLKQMDTKCGSYETLDNNSELLLVVRPLIEAREVTISLLRTVSSSAFMPLRPKASRWSFISMTLQKRKVSCEEGNGEGSLDVSFQAFYEGMSCKDVDGERVQMAQNELQTLEASIQGLESGLQCLFKRLIQIRVSLLNILSL